MSDEPKCIKISKVELSGSWRPDHPTASGAIKYSCTGGGKIKVTLQNGTVETYDIKADRAVWVVNDMIHFPYAP